MKNLACYVCGVLLGVSYWLITATAQANPNSNPTCDEIAYFVPEVLATAPKNFWFHGHYWQSILDSLATQQLQEFADASISVVRSQLPDNISAAVAASHISNRQTMAEQILDARETLDQINAWWDSQTDDLSCTALADYAGLFGATVLVGSSFPSPYQYPGAVVGITIVAGSTFYKHMYGDS